MICSWAWAWALGSMARKAPVIPAGTDALLLESGDVVLLESGDRILLEG